MYYKYNIPKRTTIGKKCDDNPTMMYPSPNFIKYFPDVELPVDEGGSDRSSCLRVGTYMVLEKVMIESILSRIVPYIYNDGRCKDASGDIFSYQSFVKMQEANLPVLIDIFNTSTGIK